MWLNPMEHLLFHIYDSHVGSAETRGQSRGKEKLVNVFIVIAV